MNLRVNFDKNKKASRIKALREFAMKRLTDFFEEKGWKTGKMGYNENRKRSKYCSWTVPMRDWNLTNSGLNLTTSNVEPYLWEIETYTLRFSPLSNPADRLKGWTVPMRDWNIFLRYFFRFSVIHMLNRTYERLKLSYWHVGRTELTKNVKCWTVPMRDWNFQYCTSIFHFVPRWTVPMRDWNNSYNLIQQPKYQLNRTYERLKLKIVA